MLPKILLSGTKMPEIFISHQKFGSSIYSGIYFSCRKFQKLTANEANLIDLQCSSLILRISPGSGSGVRNNP